jgi:hypothetical protein
VSSRGLQKRFRRSRRSGVPDVGRTDKTQNEPNESVFALVGTKWPLRQWDVETGCPAVIHASKTEFRNHALRTHRPRVVCNRADAAKQTARRSVVPVSLRAGAQMKSITPSEVGASRPSPPRLSKINRAKALPVAQLSRVRKTSKRFRKPQRRVSVTDRLRRTLSLRRRSPAIWGFSGFTSIASVVGLGAHAAPLSA